jgi:hypothetical protein
LLSSLSRGGLHPSVLISGDVFRNEIRVDCLCGITRVVEWDRMNNTMASYEPGDYIKAEFKDDMTGESEWMWLRVDYCDEAERIVFGQLDSQPVLDHGEKLKLGSQIAVSYKNIRQHKKASEFSQQ